MVMSGVLGSARITEGDVKFLLPSSGFTDMNTLVMYTLVMYTPVMCHNNP